MKKLFALVSLSLIATSTSILAQSYPVTLKVISDLPTMVMTPYNLGVFVENPYMISPSDPRSGAIGNQGGMTTHLAGSSFNNSTTNLDIFHDSQSPGTTFCILNIQLDPVTSDILSVNWTKNTTWQPDPVSRTKPAVCSFSVSDHTITVLINYGSSS